MTKKTTITAISVAAAATLAFSVWLLHSPPPPITPIVGHSAFAGDVLALPDEEGTYTVPPGTRIIFQQDPHSPWATCRMTWEEVAGASGRDVPNQCRMRVGGILWYYARCFKMVPLGESPADKAMREMGYTERVAEGSADCHEEREREAADIAREIR